MADNVIQGSFGGTPFREAGELYDDIWQAIMQYEDRVSLMAVVGVLRLVEHKLLTDVHNAE